MSTDRRVKLDPLPLRYTAIYGPEHLEHRDKTKAICQLVRRLNDLGCEVEVKHAA